jgi:hypothetical protein
MWLCPKRLHKWPQRTTNMAVSRHHLDTEIRTKGAVVDPATGGVVREYPTATDEQMN